MTETESELKTLMRTLPQTGTVQWIGLRPKRRSPIQVVDEVMADLDQGLVGDRYNGKRGSIRQVTLIQQEHLAVIGTLLEREPIAPELLRRNIVVSGINLIALKNLEFEIGDAILKGTGPCQPCSLMEYQLGPGGYNAMRGHGGLTATIIRGGRIWKGASVSATT